eukprot:gb/GFBE01043149.1/.p1 GENE.gb/GFBE01043149.1/~~gb/GFBE01043149.1/.p1  ORF type:complete len:364 (+),score=59.75 gb/GFBE01043149.1/:1-1092(+)
MADAAAKPDADVKLQADAKLPGRPYIDLPENHCMLEGCRFSFLPLKHRAEISLPPMKMCKSKSETCLGRSGRRDGKPARRAGGGQARNKEQPAVTSSGVDGCFGDFCSAQIRLPGSLKDIESANDPWMRQARALCLREVKLSGGPCLPHSLMEPEELVACLELRHGDASAALGAAPSQVGRQSASVPCRVRASLILEARNHPNLCSWLEKHGWRLNAQDADAVAEAAEQLREDDRMGGGDISILTDGCTAGLRYRLKECKVCRTCLGIYNIIHSVVTMIRVQKRDLWAQREQLRRRLAEERERERTHQEEIERRLPFQQQRSPQSAPRTVEGHVSAKRRSLFLDKDVQDFLRSADYGSPSLML